MSSVQHIKKPVKLSDKSLCFSGVWLIVVFQCISDRFTENLSVWNCEGKSSSWTSCNTAVLHTCAAKSTLILE